MRSPWLAWLMLTGTTFFVFAGCRLLSSPLAAPASPQKAVTPAIATATATPALPRIDTVASDIEEQLVTQVYERVSPAVVHITSKVIQYSYFWGPIPQEGTGSGFIIDEQGHVLTNDHVVSGAEEVEVTLADGTVWPASVVGTDPYHDLAVLKVDAPTEELTAVVLGTSADLRVGQRAIAIGNPFGLDRTLTVGVISSLGRIIEREGEFPLGEAIQTDAAINPGNSGGPLLSSQGQVIGVNTAIRSPSGGSVGIGFAVPVDAVRRVVPELIEKGYYAHPWLGFEAYAIVPALARGLSLPVEKGLLIARVYADGPADRAGLRGADRSVRVGNYVIWAGGDIVTEVDGVAVASMQDLTVYLETRTRVGDELSLTVWRDGTRQVKVVTVGERPKQ